MNLISARDDSPLPENKTLHNNTTAKSERTNEYILLTESRES